MDNLGRLVTEEILFKKLKEGEIIRFHLEVLDFTYTIAVRKHRTIFSTENNDYYVFDEGNGNFVAFKHKTSDSFDFRPDLLDYIEIDHYRNDGMAFNVITKKLIPLNEYKNILGQKNALNDSKNLIKELENELISVNKQIFELKAVINQSKLQKRHKANQIILDARKELKRIAIEIEEDIKFEKNWINKKLD